MRKDSENGGRNGDAEVVSFPERKKTLFEIDRSVMPGAGECSHLGTAVISTRRRLVYCSKCKDVLDMYEILYDLARGEQRRYRSDEALREAQELIDELAPRGLRLRWSPGGRQVAASALGTSGQRIEASVSSYRGLRDLMVRLKSRLKRWGDRELEYPRFTSVKKRGENIYCVGLLGEDGSWQLLGEREGISGAHDLIEKEATRRGVKPILEDRPRALWRGNKR